jgi:hypothetical protein
MVWVRDPNPEDRVADTLSVAFEGWLSAPDAHPGSLAWYAVKRVRAGRMFRQSVRSIDGPIGICKERPQRMTFDVGLIWRDRDNPARIVAFTLDFRTWLESLSEWDRTVAETLALGYTTSEAAALLGRTAGRISQKRRELAERWTYRR